MPNNRVIRCSNKAYQVVAKVAGATGLSLSEAMEVVIQERVLTENPNRHSFEEWLKVLERGDEVQPQDPLDFSPAPETIDLSRYRNS